MDEKEKETSTATMPLYKVSHPSVMQMVNVAASDHSMAALIACREMGIDNSAEECRKCSVQYAGEVVVTI